jgi:tRNA (guanine-N7-)-methyltransferase
VNAVSDDRPAAPGKRILYGRRSARRLRAGRRAAVEQKLPGIQIVLPPDEGPLDPAGLFDHTPSGLWLEVGFGAGEHLLEQARAHPDAGFIGCEPFFDGVAKLVQALDDEDIGNVRIFTDDARLMLRRLPPSCLAGAFILFSDPWPKTRHHKRRFISAPVLELLAQAMAPGAELRIATDHRGHLVWILEHLHRSEAFEWLARRADDWRRRPPDWPATRYERKAISAGRDCIYLRYRRRDGGRAP